MTDRDHPLVSRPLIAAVDLVGQGPTVLTGARIQAAMPGNQLFLDFLAQLPREAGLPSRAHADFTTLRPWLGNLMILDPVDDGADFSYRLYGTGIVRQTGFDMTGRRVSSFVSTTGRFFQHWYRHCYQTGETVLTSNAAEHATGLIRWERVVSAFRTERGGRQIIATNYATPLEHCLAGLLPPAADALPTSRVA